MAGQDIADHIQSDSNEDIHQEIDDLHHVGFVKHVSIPPL